MQANAAATYSTVMKQLRAHMATSDCLEDMRNEFEHTFAFLMQVAKEHKQAAASQLTLATLVDRRDLMVRSQLPP